MKWKLWIIQKLLPKKFIVLAKRNGSWEMHTPLSDNEVSRSGNAIYFHS